MKILRLNEIVNNEDTIKDKINKNELSYHIWIYYNNIDSYPSNFSLKSSGYKTLEDAYNEVEDLRKKYKGSNVRLVISENINSISVLSDEEVSMKLNANKYNL